MDVTAGVDMATCVPGQYVWLCGTDCPADYTARVCGALHGSYVVGDTCDFPGGRCEQFDRDVYCDCTGKVVQVQCKGGLTPEGGSC